MDPRAALHAVSGASHAGGPEGRLGAPDPLARLEAELGGAGAEREDAARLYQGAVELLEDAWSVFTECRVMRDGLLEACQEIERTMDTVQARLGDEPQPPQSNGRTPH